MSKKKRILTWLKISIIAILLMLIIFYLRVGKNIVLVHYICEIPFDTEIYDVIDPATYRGPSMHSYKSDDPLLYKDYLNDIFKGAKLSEEEIQNIKNKISDIPDDKYIYVVVDSKLICVNRKSEVQSDGVYSAVDVNSVFIYWANKPLGRVRDGYV